MGSTSSLKNTDMQVNTQLRLIEAYIDLKERKNIGTCIIGIQGPPGIGKTTLSSEISSILRGQGYRIETVSVDDFYLSLRERLSLSHTFPKNPLYQISRGMPGTHRTGYLKEVLNKVKKGEPFRLPIFDKTLEKGRGEITERVREIDDTLDFFILEGWCVAMPDVTPQKLFEIFRRDQYVLGILEELHIREEDFEPVTERLKEYQEIWNFLDMTTCLQAQDLRYIEDWKIDQESELFRAKEQYFDPLKVERFAKYFIPLSFYLSESLAFENERFQRLIIDKRHLIQNQI